MSLFNLGVKFPPRFKGHRLYSRGLFLAAALGCTDIGRSAFARVAATSKFKLGLSR